MTQKQPQWKTLDAKELAHVTGGGSTQPQPWLKKQPQNTPDPQPW